MPRHSRETNATYGFVMAARSSGPETTAATGIVVVTHLLLIVMVREGGRIAVPIRFEIPAGLPETGVEDGVRTSWNLRLSTDRRMDGFALFRFVVPVFLPRASSR